MICTRCRQHNEIVLDNGYTRICIVCAELLKIPYRDSMGVLHDHDKQLTLEGGGSKRLRGHHLRKYFF